MARIAGVEFGPGNTAHLTGEQIAAITEDTRQLRIGVAEAFLDKGSALLEQAVAQTAAAGDLIEVAGKVAD